ncbi:MAG: DUF4279 domain-containing protein [Chloroflexi bacterium]|nr:DUF4279 domain-containing protein [Chloroflexota bacterium]MCI0644847.1 DUF4279 domain-containing protein [Chloroflexota bacterium]MCI0731427.1 DUF4279 domain-containing protein [Chloroflexota bacterium]
MTDEDSDARRSHLRMQTPQKMFVGLLIAAKYISVGGAPSDSKATLCIYADDIDLVALTNSIGRQPTKARRKGETDVERPKIRPAPIGQWFLEAPKGLPFTEKIEFLLEATESNPEVWRQLRQSHDIQLRCAIFLHSWTEGFSFPPEIIAELANRYWEFSLSMYSAEGDEIVEAFLNKGKDSEQI